jgi:hypothetical protein
VTNIERHYDQFSNDERFRLLVAALARGDKLDEERLWRSGPRELFWMPEPELVDCYQLAWSLVAAFVLRLERALDRLDLLDALRKPVRACCESIGDAATFAAFTAVAEEDSVRVCEQVEAATDQCVQRLPDLLEGIERGLTGHAAAITHAFANSSRALLALEPETLLGAFYPDRLPEFSDLMAEAADPDTEAAYVAWFCLLHKRVSD